MRVPISAFKENLPTEGIGTQSQARAREIVNSEEFDDLMNQYDHLLDKIDDKEKFFKDIINDDEFNEALLKEHLKYTLFKSLDGFMNEIEKIREYSNVLVTKYAKDIQDERFLNAVHELNNSEIRMYDLGYTKCAKRHDSCKRRARNQYGAGALACCISGLYNPICGIACVVTNAYLYDQALKACYSNYEECRGRK